MFFGTVGFGILVYENKQWSKISIPQSYTIYSFAKNEQGMIFVGGVGDFGYLKSKDNTYVFKSLLNKEWKKKNPVDVIWSIAPSKLGVYFFNYEVIYRWYDNKLYLIKAKDFFYKMTQIKEKIYLRCRGKGIFEIKENHLEIIKNGDFFSHKSFLSCVNYNDDFSLFFAGEILSDNKKYLEAYLYNNQDFSYFKIDAIDYLKDNSFYCSAKLPKNLFALGTKSGGVVIIDKNGNTKYIINKKNGLVDDYIRQIYVDNKNRLWLATSYGISRIDIFSPFFTYDENTGFKGEVRHITRYNGKIYIATNYGLYQEAPLTTMGRNLFKKMDLNHQVFCFFHTDDSLILGTNSGFCEIKNDEMHIELFDENYFRFSSSKLNSEIIYAGTSKGLILLKKTDGRWKKYKAVEKLNSRRIYCVCEIEPGIMYVYRDPDEFIKLDFKKGFHLEPDIYFFPKIKEGMFYDVDIYFFNNKLYISSSKGIFSFCEKQQDFISDQTFGDFSDIPVSEIILDYSENAWVIAGYEREICVSRKQEDGSYKLNSTPFLKQDDFFIKTIFPERDGTVWFGGKSKMICYDPKYE